MSYSTTQTSSYILVKYSRSYPVKRNLPKNVVPSNSTGQHTIQEWQHYTNPVIRVILDTRIDRNKEVESVKLRVVWQINPNEEAEISQQDVVFEDMDLLSFSSITAPIPRKHQNEGLPLKAVYRDTTVGIRYFHSREDGITPVYRRFQMSFQSLSDASNFITLITPFCPCRLTPSSEASFAVPQSQVTGVPPRPPIQAPYTFKAANSLLSNRGSPLVNADSASSSVPLPERRPMPAFSSPLSSDQPFQAQIQPLVSSPLGHTSDCPAPAVMNCSSSPFQSSPALPPAQQSSFVPPISNQAVYQRQTYPLDGEIPTQVIAPVNVPPPSLPTSSTAEPVGHAVPANQNGSVVPFLPTDLPSQVLASFSEASAIYDLPDAVLTKFIEEIIHEDKFLQLVEKLSEMVVIRRVANV